MKRVPLWGDYSSRDVWLTAYALGFMQDARDRGFNVPDSGLERTRQWLLEQLQQTPNNFGTWSANLRKGLESGRFDSSSAEVLRNDHRRFAGLAAAALALARDGKAPLSTVRQLFDNYGERARSPLPLIQLAAAFKLLGDEGRMKTALEQGMTRAYGITRRGSGYYDEWLGDYGSSVRDYAQAYALLNQYGLRDARSENLLEQAAARMGNRSYLSTQEQMALLLAANSAGGDRAAPWQAMLQQAGTSRNLSSAQDQTLEIGPAELAATRLRNTGNQSLFVGLGLMRLVVQGDGLDITRESVLQVQPAYAAERRARRIRLNPGEEWTPPADLLANWHADSVTASMTLSNRPPLNVNRLVQGLLNYPYGCTEQTISATLPWVIIDEAAAKRFGMTPRTLAERQAKIDGALARLSGMRGATGAYSLWGDYSSPMCNPSSAMPSACARACPAASRSAPCPRRRVAMSPRRPCRLRSTSPAAASFCPRARMAACRWRPSTCPRSMCSSCAWIRSGCPSSLTRCWASAARAAPARTTMRAPRKTTGAMRTTAA
jgi:uncharacterized protein YfaS (alpha-2-macroglobulin family)